MTNQQRYLVVYKDDADSRNLYYGPFVSLSIAEHFMNALPEPLEGGLKTFKSFQPYSHSEDTLAGEVILRKRSHGDLLETINEIASV